MTSTDQDDKSTHGAGVMEDVLKERWMPPSSIAAVKLLLHLNCHK